jgi:LPXTG-motif cell wall-anchored protein
MIIGFGHKLTPYAALGLSIIMVLAGIFHSRRKENAALIINFLLLAACLFVFFNR